MNKRRKGATERREGENRKKGRREGMRAEASICEYLFRRTIDVLRHLLDVLQYCRGSSARSAGVPTWPSASA